MGRRAFALRGPDRNRWRAVRLLVLARDLYRCQSCGRAAGILEVDHRVPISQGGDPWAPSNLQALCRGCHLGKTRVEQGTVEHPERVAWRRLVAGTG